MIEWTANVRSSEGGIADVKDTMTFGNSRDGREISKRKGWIRRTLTEDELGIGLNRRLDRLRVGEVHKAKLHS